MTPSPASLPSGLRRDGVDGVENTFPRQPRRRATYLAGKAPAR
jgi:hypothetical protein